MNGAYTRGIAFIMEGTTEKVFYQAFLKWIAESNSCTFLRGESIDKGDIYFEWVTATEKVLIKFNVVGTVTQVSHSGKWFSTKCSKEHRISCFMMLKGSAAI